MVQQAIVITGGSLIRIIKVYHILDTIIVFIYPKT